MQDELGGGTYVYGTATASKLSRQKFEHRLISSGENAELNHFISKR